MIPRGGGLGIMNSGMCVHFWEGGGVAHTWVDLFLEGQHAGGHISLGWLTTTLTMLIRINWGRMCIVSCQCTMLYLHSSIISKGVQ